MHIIVGTFTNGFMGGTPSHGLYVLNFDRGSGKFTHTQTVEGLNSPSFVCRHPHLPVIYSAERQLTDAAGSEGGISSWRLSAEGQLSLLGRRPSGGAFTAHVQVSPDGKYLAAANPLGPTVSCFSLDEQGIPAFATAVVAHEGRGARERQARPWPHSAFFDSNSKRLLACDLALDRVLIYEIDAGGNLSPGEQPYAQVCSGAGSRHLVISPDGQFIYVVNELDSTLSVFSYDLDGGRMIALQTVPTTPAEWTGENHPSEIAISPRGTRLYICNRGHDSVAVFEINTDSGRISNQQHFLVSGRELRHIALSPDGELAFLSKQLSDEIEVLCIDELTGRLQSTGIRVEIPSPACVVVSDFHVS